MAGDVVSRVIDRLSMPSSFATLNRYRRCRAKLMDGAAVRAASSIAIRRQRRPGAHATWSSEASANRPGSEADFDLLAGRRRRLKDRCGVTVPPDGCGFRSRRRRKIAGIAGRRNRLIERRRCRSSVPAACRFYRRPRQRARVVAGFLFCGACVCVPVRRSFDRLIRHVPTRSSALHPSADQSPAAQPDRRSDATAAFRSPASIRYGEMAAG